MKRAKRLMTTVAILTFACSCSVLKEALEMNSEEKAITRQEAAAMQARIDSTIAAGTIHSGYTKKQVKKAWGTPDYRSCCALDVDFKILYQWVYTSRNYYVYFIGNRCSYIVSFLDAEKERQKKLRGVDPWKRKQNENEY